MFRKSTTDSLLNSLYHKHVQIVHVRNKKTHWVSKNVIKK